MIKLKKIYKCLENFETSKRFFETHQYTGKWPLKIFYLFATGKKILSGDE